MVGKRLRLESDTIVHGGVNDVVELARRQPIDALASTDVIEHVYDIGEFVDGMARLGDEVTVVHKTAANPLNPWVRRRHYRLHYSAEFEDDEQNPAYTRDDRESNFTLRRRIVADHDSELTPTERDQLAQRTRGWIEAEIRRAVEEYRDRDELPTPISHPSNKCNPYTGNWCERLMNPYEVAGRLKQAGFDETEVRPHTYGPSGNNLLKRSVTELLNVAIRRSSRIGLLLSPSYTVYGHRRSTTVRD